MRHRRMLAPINSVKHLVNHADATVASGAIVNDVAVDSIVAPGNASPFSVSEGSLVKAIYVERWIGGTGATGVQSQFTLTVEKKRQLEANMTNAQANNLGAYPNKKNILFTSQGIVPSLIDGGSTIPIIRGWVKIPKGKQRMGLDDRVMVNIAAVTSLRRCGIEIYKEYQ